MIWQFTSIWNDFLFAVIVTSRPAMQPITVALNNLAGQLLGGMERADGRSADRRPSDASHLRFPQPLLHERASGGVGEGLSLRRGAPSALYSASLMFTPAPNALFVMS